MEINHFTHLLFDAPHIVAAVNESNNVIFVKSQKPIDANKFNNLMPINSII